VLVQRWPDCSICTWQVVVPTTFTEYTSRRVLTTSWLEGEKLSGSDASDVGELVNLGVICYLKQLLDTGFFHVRRNVSSLVAFTFRIDR
jgi:aarF domain-containing kinase